MTGSSIGSLPHCLAQDDTGPAFLIDHSVVDTIVSHAELGPQDWVLEIGPGEGILTRELAARAGLVYAVEIDPDLAANLCSLAANVQVIHADALTVPLPEYNKIVSNLPYSISSKITYRLLARPFDLAVLMFQRSSPCGSGPKQAAKLRPAGNGGRLLLPYRDPGERLQKVLPPCSRGGFDDSQAPSA